MRFVLPLAIVAAATAFLTLTPAGTTVAGLDHKTVGSAGA